MCWIRCRLLILWLSMKWVFRFNLGDEVVYNGKRYLLVQGVCKPRWDLAAGEDRPKYVHESEFRKVRSPYNYWHSFRSGWRFYMNSWYGIWRRNGIEPWMRGCRIW